MTDNEPINPTPNTQPEGTGRSPIGRSRNIEQSMTTGPEAFLELNETRRAKILQEISVNFNLSYTLSEDEMKSVLVGPEEAKKLVEIWLAQIEKNEKHYSFKEINQRVNAKLETALAWLNGLHYSDLLPDPEEIKRQLQAEGTAEKDLEKKVEEKIKKAQKQIDEEKENIIEAAHSRLGLHNLRRAIGLGEFETLFELSSAVGMRGLLLGFNEKKGRIAFNTYQRFFERYLYNYGKAKEDKDKGSTGATGIFQERVTPELINARIRPAVQEHLTKNWKLYGFKDLDEANEAERIGYSLFTASQRRAVHVSRGHVNGFGFEEVDFDEELGGRKIFENPTFLSDPDEVLSNLYSPLEMQLIKWSKPSKSRQALLNSIMKFMGNGNLTTGEQLYSDALKAADLFTSSWRIAKVLESMKIRMQNAYLEKSELKELKKDDPENTKIEYKLNSLATGMRLKTAKIEKDTDREDVMGKLGTVARYRPLELLKSYVVEIDRHGNATSKGPVQEKLKAMFGRGEFDIRGIKIRSYLKLEEILGRYIYPIYEKGLAEDWDKIRGVDIGSAGKDATNPFSQDDLKDTEGVIEKINQEANPYNLSVEELQGLYKKVQDFVGSSEVKDDIFANRKGSQATIFDRTLYVDDVPFHKLETHKFNDIPLSTKYNDIASGGRDSYRRIWGDTQAAYKANESYMKAILATDPDHLLEALVAGAQSQDMYAGKGPAMKLVYGISGGWLALAKSDALYGMLGLGDKLPIPTSELERLFGEGAASLSREDMFKYTEKLKLIFGDLTKEFPEVGEIEKRMRKLAGVDKLMIFLTRSKTLALIILMALLQQMMKQAEEDSAE